MTNKIYYFAYGSNLLKNRLIERVGLPLSEEVFSLQNWCLTFNAGYFDAFANIVPQEGVSVQGVLYGITTEQAKKLDLFEALYNRFYFILGDKICFCYVAKITYEERLPTLSYINYIISGAYNFNLLQTLDIAQQKKKEIEIFLENFKPKKKKKRKNKSEFVDEYNLEIYF